MLWIPSPIGFLVVVFERLWPTADQPPAPGTGYQAHGLWLGAWQPPAQTWVPAGSLSALLGWRLPASNFGHSKWMVSSSSRSTAAWPRSGAEQGLLPGRAQALPKACGEAEIKFLQFACWKAEMSCCGRCLRPKTKHVRVCRYGLRSFCLPFPGPLFSLVLSPVTVSFISRSAFYELLSGGLHTNPTPLPTLPTQHQMHTLTWNKMRNTESRDRIKWATIMVSDGSSELGLSLVAKHALSEH